MEMRRRLAAPKLKRLWCGSPLTNTMNENVSMAEPSCEGRAPYSARIPHAALLAVLLVTCGSGLAASRAHAAVAIEMVTVGDPGNAPNADGLGAVPYAYRIGTYEITIGQYADFLNAVAASDPYGLYNEMMATAVTVAGIERSGDSGSHRYRVIGSPLRPITYVSWWDAARFCNWLHNGQGSGSTEEGAYPLDGAVDGVPPKASANARFTIPTESEWFKAGYFKGGDANAGYWAYATQSDTPPGNDPLGGPNQANYRAAGVFCTTQQQAFHETASYLTDVGAFSGSISAYGTFDQQGNVQEWNDLTGVSDPARGLRGGSWYQGLFFLKYRNAASTPTYENNSTGFRVVSPVAP